MPASPVRIVLCTFVLWALVCTQASARLPPAVLQALARAQVPADAVSVVVQDVAGPVRTRLRWRADEPVNPASLTKLLTTYAALDLLGPAWTWTTPVWIRGSVSADGVLDGDLVIRGSGDPKLVVERLWLLLRRVQQYGIREIRGDIVLDRSAFAVSEGQAADFDGEPLRPYNVRPDALLLNYRAIVLTLTPDPLRNLATVGLEPALAGLRVDPSVPLLPGACDDWRGALKADFSDPLRVRLAGGLPAACGEKAWSLAYVEPKFYDRRVLVALWRELGGTLGGTVRDGTAPTTPPTFVLTSPPLADVIREINKFSNNVMAQQLFLTLGLQRDGTGSPEAARDVLHRWLQERIGKAADGVVIDNGSGLSRQTRLSALALARVLQSAFASPVMPELMASLPVIGLDGTLTRARAAPGRAHLKTGSLRDVAGVAGYVHAPSGRRLVLVAVINHPNANAARPALDALVQWAVDEAAGTPASQDQVN